MANEHKATPAGALDRHPQAYMLRREAEVVARDVDTVAELIRQRDQLHADLTAARRALWCLAHEAGGEVSFGMDAMSKAISGGAELEVSPSLDGMRQRLFAHPARRSGVA